MIPNAKQRAAVVLGLLVVSSAAFAGAASAAPTAPSADADVAHAGDGDRVYLVFGADTGDGSLSEWVAEYRQRPTEQRASSEVVQFQDVEQLNVNAQNGSVAVSIDGGDARAIQEGYQSNDNEQVGVSAAENRDRSASFRDVDVTMIFANETGAQTFTGWTTGDDGARGGAQSADARVDQYQDVEQLNYNDQSLAFAVAIGGSEATAMQANYQSNNNTQIGVADAGNAGDRARDQEANANVSQGQSVEQANVNAQRAAVAIAIGEGSTATAAQVSYQRNANAQFAAATGTNVLDLTATAGYDPVDGSTGAQTNEQGSESTVEQFQNVSQANVNTQSAAVAVAVNGSTARALQANFQRNYNVQYGSASAANDDVREGSYRASFDDGSPTMAFDYDGPSAETDEQSARAAVLQSQYVRQLNLNEQYSAVAVAEDGGAASASQLNVQRNVNRQIGTANATDRTGCPVRPERAETARA